jgi:hypothetical protein
LARVLPTSQGANELAGKTFTGEAGGSPSSYGFTSDEDVTTYYTCATKYTYDSSKNIKHVYIGTADALTTCKTQYQSIYVTIGDFLTIEDAKAAEVNHEYSRYFDFIYYVDSSGNNILDKKVEE